ncbi:hypothetical protein HMPREF3093_04270 [Abiotrophia sp. HMSC24B09]|nr:hypothetical protein HMPREF3093_04270 [Abiotrophia sp. HMSC24B09]
MSSRPLAGSETQEKGSKRGESREPVAHFVEWTTSWGGKQGTGAKPARKLGVCVPVHGLVEQWTGRAGFQGKRGKGVIFLRASPWIGRKMDWLGSARSQNQASSSANLAQAH